MKSKLFRSILQPVGSMALAIAFVVLAGRSHAQLVSSWGLETNISGTTLTQGVAGSFSTGAISANAGPRALLPAPIPFSAIGSLVQLRGTVTLTGAPGNQQFRFGLYNSNGHNTGTLINTTWIGADPASWLGYMAQVGGGGGANDRDTLKGRLGTGAGSWLSNTDSYIVGDGPGNAVNPPGATPYNFSLLMQRLSPTSVSLDFSFVGGSINRSLSVVDTTGASASMSSINTVGFLLTPSVGPTQFSGITVEAPKVLRLRVNTTTGFVSIANKEAATTFTPSYYEISSSAGSLTPTTWLSLDGDVPMSGTTWEKAGGASSNLLSEANLLGSLSMPAQSAYAAIGKAFTPGATQDLVFSYGVTGSTTVQRGIVEYVTGGPTGDFDVDGDADSVDFLTWQRGAGTAYTATDLDNWKATYNATPAANPVPEPAAAILALSGIAALGSVRRRCTRCSASR